jgi:protein-disulfide isomerase
MPVSLRLFLSALLIASGCSAPQTNGQAGAIDPDSAAIATLDGEPITLAELDEWIKDQLLEEQLKGKSASAAHEFREERLRQLIDDRLVAAAAAAQGVEVEALLEQQRTAVSVSDEEIAKFYEENQERLGDATLEQMGPRIRSHLEGRAKRQAETSFVEGLRTAAAVEILIDAPRVEVAADGPALGPADAPVTIVEFSDFQCPFCARAGPIVKELNAKYPEQVRIVYRHFPLDSIHPRARPAAEAAACADEQGAFWPYHDLLFANPRGLSDEDLVRYAGEAGIDTEKFAQCVTEGRHRKQVERDLQEGRRVGVSGTPSFFVNGRMLGGAQPVEEFVRLIEDELERADSSS